MNLRLTLLLLLTSIAAIFIGQNSTIVEISFLYFRFSMSSALLVFFSLLGGFALGWFLHSYILYRKSKNGSIYFR
ncbi:MAG: LapA family protein [Gallionella sp.]|nr:LapA family protein [Gallionella sp.]